MQNKISARVDYETKIYDNPIELLKAIQEHAMDYQETKYEMSIIVDALKAMMTTKTKRRRKSCGIYSLIQNRKRCAGVTYWRCIDLNQVHQGNG